MSTPSGLFDAMRSASVRHAQVLKTPSGPQFSIVDPPSSSAGDPTAWPGAEALIEGVRVGGHERVDLILDPAFDLRLIVAVHSTRLGPGAGGLRRHDPVTSETVVIQDVLDLSRAMTLKNAIAETGHGGSKLALHGSQVHLDARERWYDRLARELDRLDVITGPDTGLSREDYEELARRTRNVVGVQAGGTGASAALGVKEALRATAAALGRPLSEVHVIVQGLGDLGGRLARSLAHEGATLTVTDHDHLRIDALLGALEAEHRERVRVIAPYQALDTTADILAPCALGGIIDEPAIAQLKVRAICGGSNNQLRASSIAEERHLAMRLRDAGILYVPDWIASAGGTIHGTMEVTAGDRFEIGKAQARVRRVCGWLLDEILERAKRTDQPPLEIALERIAAVL